MPGTRCAVSVCSNSLQETKKKKILTYLIIHFQKIKNYAMFGLMPAGEKTSGIIRPLQFVLYIFWKTIL